MLFASVRGVILDLDGTLADTLRDITDAVNVALRELGLPAQPMSAVRRFVGDGLPMLCRRAMGFEDDQKLNRMIEIVTREYRAHELDHTTLYPGIPELLDGLTSRGLPMAVLSNKPHASTERMVRHLCGKWRFVAVEGYRSEDMRKPDPRLALEIATAMRLPASAVCLVGDSLTDLATARAAGMSCVLATWGFRDRDELAAGSPDALIDRPTELLELLG